MCRAARNGVPGRRNIRHYWGLICYPLEVTILDSEEPDGVIRFATNPAKWARNCKKAFQTPYLVPVITVDDSDSAANDVKSEF